MTSTGILRLSYNMSVYLGRCTLRDTLCRQYLVRWTAGGCSRSTLCRVCAMSCAVCMIRMFNMFCTSSHFAFFSSYVPVRETGSHGYHGVPWLGTGAGNWAGEGRGGIEMPKCCVNLIRHFNVIGFTVV